MSFNFIALCKPFIVQLNDKSIHNILSKNRITRKRLRSKYYPEKREGQEQQDLDTFYNTLKTKYDYSTPFYISNADFLTLGIIIIKNKLI
jgi:hypothetical protein